MSTAEIDKNALISEIEENLSNSTTLKPKFVQEDVMQLFNNRDNLVSQDSIHLAAVHGVDPRLMTDVYTEKKISYESDAQDEELNLDNQFDFFISNLETSDLVDLICNNVEDESDEVFSAKEKLMNLKLPKLLFSPLLEHIKQSNPALYRALVQLPLIAGQAKNKKKSQKKRKDRKDRVTSSTDYGAAGGKVKGRWRNAHKKSRDVDPASDNQTASSSSADNAFLEPSKFRDGLAMVLAKNIAENTMSSYLTTIALLLTASKDGKISPDLALNSQQCSIPVGSSLAALFEKSRRREGNENETAEDDEEDDHDDDDEDGEDHEDLEEVMIESEAEEEEGDNDGKIHLNPFRHFVFASKQHVRCKNIQEQRDFLRYDEQSISVDGSHEKYEDDSAGGVCNPRSMQSSLGGPLSDGGSTVVSNMPEAGTSLASLLPQNDDELAVDDEDLSEEELLAQALALSMGAAHHSLGLSLGSGDGDNSDKPVDMSISAHSSPMQRSPERAHASFEETVTAYLERQSLRGGFPENLPAADPLSTFGPFCCADFWTRVSQSVDNNAAEEPHASGVVNNIISNTVSVRHVLFALLVVIGNSCDAVLTDEVEAAAAQAEKEKRPLGPQKPAFASIGSPSKASTPVSPVVVAEEDKFVRYVATVLPIAPATTTVNLIAFLLEFLTQELAAHSKNVNNPALLGSSRPELFVGKTSGLGDAAAYRMCDDRPASPTGDTSPELFDQQACRMEEVESGGLTGVEANQQAQRDLAESEWHFHQYFLVYALTTVTKLVRATMRDVVENHTSLVVLGLAGSTDALLGIDASSKLLLNLAAFSGAESLQLLPSAGHGSPRGAIYGALTSSVQAEYRSVDVLQTRSTSILTTYSDTDEQQQSSLRARQVALCYSTAAFRHQLRLSAINTFVSALSVHHTTAYKRYVYLEGLLKTTPTLMSDSCGHLFEHSSLLQLLNVEHSQSNVEAFLRNSSNHAQEVKREPPAAFYQLYLLQRVCAEVLRFKDGDLEEMPHFPKLSNKGSTGSSADFSDRAETSAYLHLSIKAKSDAEVKEGVLLSETLERIQRLLLFRLQDGNLMEGALKHRSFSAEKCLFWGELSLLRSLQSTLVDYYLETISTSTRNKRGTHDLVFNAKKCHPNMGISEDGKVVVHNGPKLWATCATSSGFEPNSGVYEWVVRIDRCTKGHAFIGVVTAECSLEKDSYVGVDRNGYGCIGTKALWHNKAKVSAEYGTGFGTGSIIACKLDTTKGTFSLALVDGNNASTDWGVAFESLPKSKLFPGFSLHEKDDQISLLYCGKVGSNSPSALTASSSSSRTAGDLSPTVRVNEDTGSVVDENSMLAAPSPYSSSAAPAGAETVSAYPTASATVGLVLSEKEYEAESRFVGYVHQLFAVTTPILSLAEIALEKGSSSVDEISGWLSHPFIGVLLASLSASLASNKYKLNNSLHMSTLHVLPLLTMLTKRLAGIYDAISAMKHFSSSGATSSSKAEFAYKLTGSFMMRSVGSAANSTTSQDYVVHFNELPVNLSQQSLSPEDEASSHSDVSLVSKLSGSGFSINTGNVVTFSGTQYGTRVKILETWLSSTVSSVQSTVLNEGRISLCGMHFSGRFRDLKTGKMGSFSGTRICDSVRVSSDLVKNDPHLVRGTLFKTLLLCTSAVSKMSAHIMISNVCSEAPPDAAVQTPLPVDPAEDSAMSVDGAEVPETATTSASEHALAMKCARSDLMSGGFHVSRATLADHMFDCLYGFLRPSVASDGASNSSTPDVYTRHPLLLSEPSLSVGNKHSSSGATADSGCHQLSWWLSAVFPELESQIVSKLREDAGDFSPQKTLLPQSDSADHSENAFYHDLVACKENNMATVLDSTVSLYAGQSALVKIGGEAMQHARRVVLAAMIKQTGSYALCVYEYNLINTPKVSGASTGDYRPNSVLLDVWRAVQRVIERTVRYKQETNSTYAAVCRTLCSKAEFLLEIEQSKQGSSVAESLAQVLTAGSSSHSPRSSSAMSAAPASGTTEWWLQADSGHTIAQDVANCVSNTVEFLVNSLKSANAVREIMFQHAFNALLRTAGMKSLLILLNKASVSADGYSKSGKNEKRQSNVTTLSALSQLSLQSIPIQQMLQALRDMEGSAVSEKKSVAELVSNMSPALTAHYLDGLSGVGDSLLHSCRAAFESMYEYITNYLSRCCNSNAGFRDGQIIALAAWGIVIKPEDHSFLNRVSIFRVLQSVLEDARSSIAAVYAQYPYESYFQKASENIESDFAVRFKDHKQGIFACDILLSSHKRLAQLVLSVVHGLSIQVASVKETSSPSSVTSGASRLQKVQSGPDTLSRSLFDLMYVELFTTMKILFLSSDKAGLVRSGSSTSLGRSASTSSFENTSRPASSASSLLQRLAASSGNASISFASRRTESPTATTAGGGSDGSPDEFLEGEQYIYRILRLLFMVSGSKVCQRLLSSAKWLSLLIAGIGYGSLSIQRRIMTLLRRLLMNTDPANVVALVPRLIDVRDDIISAESALDDDDFTMLVGIQSSESGDTSGASKSPERLVRFMLEAIAVIYYRSGAIEEDESEENQRRAEFIAALNERGTLDALSADAVVVLRVLYGMPAWRTVISREIAKILGTVVGEVSDYSSVVPVDRALFGNSVNQLYTLNAALAVFGGYHERLRVGGLVTMKPFCLVSGASDVFANKIAAASYNSAMLVGMSASTASVEVVLMEKGLKITSQKATSTTKADVMIQHTTLLACSIPVKTLRLNNSDVMPSADVSVIPAIVYEEVVAQLLSAVSKVTIPLLMAQTAGESKSSSLLDDDTQVLSAEDITAAASESTGATSESEKQQTEHLKALRVLSSVFAAKSLSIALQSDAGVQTMLTSTQHNVFADLLSLSVLNTEYGNLNVLECLEDRLTKLWMAFCKPEVRKAATPAKSEAQQLQAAVEETTSAAAMARERVLLRQAGRERVEREAREAREEGSSLPLRDIASLLSPFGASARLVAAGGGGIDPATKAAALTQMLEMGLPQDHAEFALRRSRYSVEMAINMCFEHGDQLSAMIAEEQAQIAAATARAERGESAASTASANRRSQFLRSSEGSITNAAAAVESRIQRLEQRIAAASAMTDNALPASLRRSSQQAAGTADAAATETQSSRSDPQGLVRQLMGLGFPPAWCARALANNGSDLDSLLGMMLSGEGSLDPMSEDSLDHPPSSRPLRRPVRRAAEENISTAMDMDQEPDSDAFDEDTTSPLLDDSLQSADGIASTIGSAPFNPVVAVSGHCDIKQDLSCSISAGGFPSVGCRHYPVATGKWYYELTVYTAGCVQLGWVDNIYEGNADAGQGVGDDAHSWAYDGWRTYLWHETAAEWGTKWAAGDVVGCALDCDEKTMSFFLNGYGVEVSMGEAFRDFDFHGGLYPCVSFNRNEKVKFNFGGSTDFKHTPPPGYRAYSENINAIRENNKAIMRIFKSVAAARSSNRDSDFVAAAVVPEDEAQLEDSFESAMGERAFPHSRRYFAPDDSSSSSTRAITSETFNYFANSSHYLPKIPASKQDIANQMSVVGKDLSILYSRLCVLRTLNKISSIGSIGTIGAIGNGASASVKDSLIQQTLFSGGEEDSRRTIETVFNLVRIASLHTSRTKAYLSGMSLFPSTFSTPPNFGSIFCTGGHPLLLQLRDSFSSVVKFSRARHTSSVVDSMLAEIFSITRAAARRDLAPLWKLDDNFAPIASCGESGGLTLMNEFEGSYDMEKNVPSLSLAVWMTSILMEQFLKELNLVHTSISAVHLAAACDVSSQEQNILNDWIIKLLRVWMFALRSPAVGVKLCVMRIVTYILQEFMTSSDARTEALLHNIVTELFTHNTLLQRYEDYTQHKLNSEKNTWPVCSEYLQALLEFSTTLKNIFHLHTLQNAASADGTLVQQQTSNVASEDEDVLMRTDSTDQADRLRSSSSSVSMKIDLPENHSSDTDSELDALSPFSESACEEDDPAFNWEAVSGRVFSDVSSCASEEENSGWVTYSGSVKVLKTPEWPTAVRRGALTERQDLPPELMPGCKVLRQVARPQRMSGSKRPRGESEPPKPDAKDLLVGEEPPVSSSADESSSRNASHDSESSASALFRAAAASLSPMDRIKRIFERGSEKSLSSSGEKVDKSPRSGSLGGENSSDEKGSNYSEGEDVVDLIGTVLGIYAWPNDRPGTAREVLWENGDKEVIRWGAGDVYDATHVAMRGSKVATRYPAPISQVAQLTSSGFGADQTYGVLFRMRHVPKRAGDDDEDVQFRVICLVEFPDLCATALATGHCYHDGTYTLTEQRLISGANHSGWEARFGTAHYQPGTSYNFNVSHTSGDPSDPSQGVLRGEYHFTAEVAGTSYHTLGDLNLQRGHLFFFDDKLKASNLVTSQDKLSVTKTTQGSQGVIFGTVGFSSGVHYWEFKVEQAEAGSIFVGVCEKPADIKNARLTRWMGAGFASNRASFKTGMQSLGERVTVYGDHFHTGDLVGVMLDMNRGKLSFFLDGLKYGEHTVSDLGTAFDNLSNAAVKPPTLFPLVGLSKNQDRVTLTPRWLSAVGASIAEEYKLYNKAWLLLSSWSIERPMNKPFSEHMWIYREGWRNWLSWRSGKFIRIRTRCTIAPVPVVVNVTARACVVASIKLGLSVALFSGDHVQFSKTSGKKLDVKEEAVILGVYNGLLWYRLDAQVNDGAALMESNALAWSLLPSDVEGMVIVRRRAFISSGLPQTVVDIPLPRIPAFHGGLLNLYHDAGAIVRDGLEIDTSDVVCTIPANTTVYSIEKRMNSSNVDRYRVVYDGHHGWISERMRGGGEEVMLRKVTSATDQEKETALAALLVEAAAAGFTDRIVYKDVNSLIEAVDCWEKSVEAAGFTALLSAGGLLAETPSQFAHNNAGSTGADDASFEHFLSLSSTMDGVKQWSVEADMQLVELISKCAARDSVTPHNLSATSLARAIAAERMVGNEAHISCLANIDVNRAIARSAILRVANLIFGHALPYINMMLPEEKLKVDVVGSDCDIDILPTAIPSAQSASTSFQPQQQNSNISGELYGSAVQPTRPGLSVSDATKYKDLASFDETNKTKNPLGSWVPLCCARRMRSLRRLLFNQTKQLFFESILDATATVTPLHQDEYEDPREIKSLRINRVKATASKLSTITSPSERLKQTVFGQLHKELRQWNHSSFRRSYVGKGHGSQKRAFKVKFIGEGVNDYGGPYRAVFEQIIDELQCTSVITGGKKPSDTCLLPLLTPCPNRFASVGNNQDKYVLTTAPSVNPVTQELMQFLGKILGTAVRHNLNLALDLSSLFWRPLVRVPVSRAHLQSVDALLVTNLSEVTKLGLKIEADQLAAGRVDSSFQPEEWTDLTFTTYLPDGSRVPLLTGGTEIPVNVGNWRDYVTLSEQVRLRESNAMFKVLRDGLSLVLPTELFPLFTASELQHLISGSSQVDVQLIRQCTEYEDMDPTGPLVTQFWEVLQEMTDEEKTLFLRFVWARSRMPASAQDVPVNFKLQGQSNGDKSQETVDSYLPHAQTCFFSLSLPSYSSKEIMRSKLLYAINNSPNMDADVRLHSAEGWADN